MSVANLEDALDEFDARYLECYHQITKQFAAAAIGPMAPHMKLLLPLLLPRDMDAAAMGPPLFPPRPIGQSSLSLGPPLSLGATSCNPRIEVLEQLPLVRADLQLPLFHLGRQRMHRLLLALSIAPKSDSRRARDRRNTVATYVGNPFYRGRTLPQARRKSIKDKTVDDAKTVPFAQFDVGEFDSLAAVEGSRFNHYDFGRGRLESVASVLYRS